MTSQKVSKGAKELLSNWKEKKTQRDKEEDEEIFGEQQEEPPPPKVVKPRAPAASLVASSSSSESELDEASDEDARPTTGSKKRRRRGFGAPAKKQKTTRPIVKPKRGEMEMIYDKDFDIRLMHWFDRASVLCASNFYGLREDDDVEQPKCWRWSRQGGIKTRLQIEVPEMVQEYNAGMG